MAEVIKKLENYSIYVLLSLRGAEPGFHWGIFVPTDKPEGELWHATNRSGGWTLDNRVTSGVPHSISLCLAFKVGTVTSQNWTTLRTTLGNVPSNGQPSPNTQEAFNCIVWVKDALLALHNAGVIHLTQEIDEIVQTAMDQAEANRPPVENGPGKARVWNETGFSTTS